MADIYVRKRGKGSRISKPKWIHINPKKFKKIPPSDNANAVQNNIRRKRNFPTSSSNGQQPVQIQRTPATSYFYSNQQNTEETNEEEKRICRFYTIKGICKRFKSECPYRHDNEIVPTSSTLIVDSTDLSRPVVNFDPEDSLYGKKFKANGDDLGGEFVVLDECGDILDIVKKEIKQEPSENMNPVVKLHKLPSNWTEHKQADLERQSNLPSSISVFPSTSRGSSTSTAGVSTVSTLYQSPAFRDRFGMRGSPSRRFASASRGAASTSRGTPSTSRGTPSTSRGSASTSRGSATSTGARPKKPITEIVYDLDD